MVETRIELNVIVIGGESWVEVGVWGTAIGLGCNLLRY